MNEFVELFRELDETTSTHTKIASLVHYFRNAPHEDIAYAIYFLAGNKLTPTVPTRVLRSAAMKIASIPEWLFEQTYEWVGDLAETTASIIPGEGQSIFLQLSEWIHDTLQPIASAAPAQQSAMLRDAWSRSTSAQRFVMNKLITGNFRVGVSQKLLIRAISQWTGLPAETIAHRLMGRWEPTASSMAMLLNCDARDSDVSRPYPFCLANPITGAVESLGSPDDFLAEWKWDGIRSQLVRRNGLTYLWSRGEEDLQGRFPEIESASQAFSDGTVFDGEILAWSGGRPLPFSALQKRIQRKRVGPKLLRDVPVVFIVYDLLEHDGQDLRERTLRERRSILESLLSPERKPNGSESEPLIFLSPGLSRVSWKELSDLRGQARERGAEGLMLKRIDSPYGVGRVVGLWWKWKMDPYRVDAVMLYAQRGHGRRATLFTDYTFGVWDGGVLVPFAKAYSGLTEEEIRMVDRWIRENTIDKFGPVHAVRHELVMEIAFENVQLSSRHKSGIAVRFPRIARIRTDKKPDQADTIDILRAWISDSEGSTEARSAK
jgi:DNA ligase-1